MKPPATRQQMVQRVERALVRLSRDRYLSPKELLSAGRKLVDCAQLRCGALIKISHCLPPAVETLGMLRGKPPACPIFDRHIFLLTKNLARICKLKNRKAKAELEILHYHTRTGAYRWIPHK